MEAVELGTLSVERFDEEKSVAATLREELEHPPRAPLIGEVIRAVMEVLSFASAVSTIMIVKAFIPQHPKTT